jgi:hypothetical protein
LSASRAGLNARGRGAADGGACQIEYGTLFNLLSAVFFASILL